MSNNNNIIFIIINKDIRQLPLNNSLNHLASPWLKLPNLP